MHLRSITLKGFKSFPNRTRLEFGSGVSVIVGPNGSGKSNITDAVLWALGEQSPLAVRGQTMQDVIFAGGNGIKGQGSCEVEVVLDNSDGALRSDFSEISIERRLDRSGEGSYRLNGARCRLVDVLEVLSDSGLGKEMHSVISQGRVEAIIHSKPLDRTALIEEAAGLTKHRKRRRRAELKLERTQGNLDRALDVEREARTRLRPLKRQAEAAELHSRLERQSLELRALLGHDALLAVRGELSDAEGAAANARRARDSIEHEQQVVAQRREETERRLADHGKQRERLASRCFATRSAAERISYRLESVKGIEEALDGRLERSRKALEAAGQSEPGGDPAKLSQLEAELAALERDRDAKLAVELEAIEREHSDAEQRAAALGERIGGVTVALEEADRGLEDARNRRRLSRLQIETVSHRRAVLEVELGALAERQRLLGSSEEASLGQKISVDQGFEAAVAAALGGHLGALVVADLYEGVRAINRAGEHGGRALIKKRAFARRPDKMPGAGAERLLAHVDCDPDLRELLERLLHDVWVVDRIDAIDADFEGVAVTRDGVAFRGASGELRRLPASGPERALAERSRKEEVETELELVSAALERAQTEAGRGVSDAKAQEERRDALETFLRELRRDQEETLEAARRSAWLIEQRRQLGGGVDDARRAQLTAEITAERRLAERLERERAETAARRRRLEATIAQDQRLLPAVRRLAASVTRALEAIDERRAALDQELIADEAVGEQAAAELRRLAQSEYDLQARLREASEHLTTEEVRAAQIRDREEALVAELAEISDGLGRDVMGGGSLSSEERHETEAKLDRLERRRERIGPVNPLAESEYQEALEHVEDLERQRKDLEEALAELEGLIRETDRLIKESFEQTFEVAARNFEDVIQHLFPGGRGSLRLVRTPRPRVVLGGAGEAAPEHEEESLDQTDASASAAAPADGDSPVDVDTPGIEIEVTPAGKTSKRLSLLSGGEKSLVALAFLFAVFLARPCPFYILDEVEAALDDVNIDRFLALVRGYAHRSQFIVITHQRRTLEAADVLYGVSMGRDGVSKVVSRRFEREEPGATDGEGRLSAVA